MRRRVQTFDYQCVLIFCRVGVCVRVCLLVALGCRGQQPAAPSDQVSEVGVFPLPAVACMSASPSFFSLARSLSPSLARSPCLVPQACRLRHPGLFLWLGYRPPLPNSSLGPSFFSSSLLPTGCSSPAAAPRSLQEARQPRRQLARPPAPQRPATAAASSASLTHTWIWPMMQGQNNTTHKKQTKPNNFRICLLFKFEMTFFLRTTAALCKICCKNHNSDFVCVCEQVLCPLAPPSRVEGLNQPGCQRNKQSWRVWPRHTTCGQSVFPRQHVAASLQRVGLFGCMTPGISLYTGSNNVTCFTFVLSISF